MRCEFEDKEEVHDTDSFENRGESGNDSSKIRQIIWMVEGNGWICQSYQGIGHKEGVEDFREGIVGGSWS